MAEETRERSGSSADLLPDSGVGVLREETAENPRTDSAVTRPGYSASGSEEGSLDDESGQSPLDPNVDVPSSSGGGPSNAPGTFDFLGARLLNDPLEALASVLPAGLFEDIGRTTPFKFAQDIIESQSAVRFFFFF